MCTTVHYITTPYWQGFINKETTCVDIMSMSIKKNFSMAKLLQSPRERTI